MCIGIFSVYAMCILHSWAQALQEAAHFWQCASSCCSHCSAHHSQISAHSRAYFFNKW
ncbi:hypothetical protein JCM19302_1008 [Jejuia pallidilutea]|uniref:Uncharacterized protein n=1 Tax=Jejuia pallidilutea TaxID=504487 RepID=A0A090W312_9FLAO|nr:hypothetical protein JCM19302_1008 [Jejuia pallidilutea]